MKFILLLAVIALFTFISTDGSPLPKKEKMNDNDENSHEDATGKLETKKDKFKSTKENNEKTIPEPLEEEEGNQLYIMVPAGKHAQKPRPFNYRRAPKMPIKPRYVLKKQNYPMPYAYPMFQDHEEMMEPETGMEYVPNVMGKRTDLPMYYIPSPRKGQFTNNGDEMKQLYKAPFIYQDKEGNPWSPYLENPDYYN